MKKALRSKDAVDFEQIPNIGKEIAKDFKILGFKTPQKLRGKNPYRLYQELCRKTGVRQDPCVLDTLISAVYFMNGRGSKPWWAFTAERKKKYPYL